MGKSPSHNSQLLTARKSLQVPDVRSWPMVLLRILELDLACTGIGALGVVAFAQTIAQHLPRAEHMQLGTCCRALERVAR